MKSEMKTIVVLAIVTVVAMPVLTAAAFVATKLVLGLPIHW